MEATRQAADEAHAECEATRVQMELLQVHRDDAVPKGSGVSDGATVGHAVE